MFSTIQVHFIGAEADVPLLARLKGSPMIGMDSEWRPGIKPFSEQKMAIFQLSNETDAFVIDLIAFKDNAVLD